MAGSLVPRSSFGDTLAKLGEVVADQQYRREARDIAGLQIDNLTQPAATGLSPLGQSSLPSFARVQGGSPSPTIAGILDDTSKKYGLDPSFLPRLAMIESRGDPNAHNASGADGLLQFMPKTAQAYQLGNTRDPIASADAGARLSLDNRRTLAQSLGREPTQGELYLGHQQGAGGAAKLLANPNARAADIVGLKAVTQNGGSPDMTAGEFAQKWTSKFPNAPAIGAGGPPTSYASGQGAFVPGSEASPAIGGGPAGASPSAPAQAQPRFTPQQVTQLKAMLANPYTAQRAQAIIEKATAPEEYGFQTVGDQLYRTSKRGGVEAVGVQKAPTFQTVKGSDGNDYVMNPQTGQLTRAIEGKSTEFTDLSDPAERAAAGIPATYTGPAQRGPNGEIKLPGKAATEINIGDSADKAAAIKASGALVDRFDAVGKEGSAARSDLALVGELRELGNAIGTGGLSAFQSKLGEYGIKFEGSGQIEAYTALLDRLTPAQRIPGAGATSDFDARMFKGSLPRLINTPEGNALISDTLEAVAKDRIARGEIADQALLGEQRGGISMQDAMKRLKELPSVQTGYAQRMKTLREAGKLGPGGATEATAGAGQSLRAMPQGVRDQAAKALSEGRDRAGVVEKLRRLGFDPSGL